MNPSTATIPSKMNSIINPSEIKTHGDLLFCFKNPLVTPSSIMKDAEKVSPQYAGFVFEAICRIFGGFRIIDPNAHLYVGNSNASHSLNPVVNWRQDFIDRSIVSGNTDGFSDISYMSKGNLVLSSCKYISADSSLEAYDIDKIYNIGRNYRGHKIALFVKDKTAFNAKYKAAHTKSNRMVDNVYDIEDLDARLKDLLNVLKSCDFNLMNIVNKYLSTNKTPLKLKFHQILCKFYLRRCSKEQLTHMIEMKCRGGKSYMMASDIIEHSSTCVLILTPIPSETKRALLKMFNSLIELDGYQVVELKRGTRIPNSEKKIFIASKQFFDKHVNDEQLTSLKFDAVYFDEMHFTGLTKKAKLIFSTHVQKDTRTVYLTATGEKVKCNLGITSEQTFQFQLEHEDLCRDGNVDGLCQMYSPEIVRQSLIEKYGDSKDYSAELKKDYAKMPKLTHIGVTMNKEFLKRIKKPVTEYTFDIDELLRIEDGNFVHPDNVNEFLNLHFGRSGAGQSSNMKKIKKYGGRVNDTKFVPTQLWFLPQGKDGGISGVSNCMEEAILNHRGFGKNYKVLKLNGEEMSGPVHNLEERIADAEKKAIEDGNSGLIVLLGSMCNMGVSLPKADIVVMLNNIHEMDRYTQMIMRCMTEDEGKERGFVVDYNQKRLLQFCLSIVKSSGHTEVERILQQATKIIDIDNEDFITEEKTDLIKHLMSVWSNSDINRPAAICSRLENVATDIVITRDDRMRFKSFMKNVSNKKLLEPNDASLFEDDDRVDDLSVTSSGSRSTTSTNSEEETAEEVPDYALEITRTLPFFTAVLTAGDSDTDFISLLNKIKNDNQMADAFAIQCKTWWSGANMDGFIDLVIEIFSRRSPSNLHTSREINSSIKMLKNEMVRMLDDKKALLELINSMLRPKKVEKKQFGEVFTPLDLVEKMLDNIPAERFKDPSLKWFDPAAGIGNFMVCIYYRLMNGLVSSFPDPKERQKHIINNMLYMSEIGPKNVSVAKLIFGDECNIHFGDTLKLNVAEKWGIEMFDEVVGNPPYNNASGNKGKGNSLWDVFMKKAFVEWVKPNGHLTFVHPPLWRQYGHELLKMMLENQILYLEIHSVDDGNKTFKCSTAYDFYTVRKSPCFGPTKIVCQEGKEQMIDLRTWKFIPNTMFDIVEKMCSSEEKLNVFYSRSDYGHDKPHVVSTQSETNKYPVIYTISKDGTPTIHWSSRNDKGHFGISKFIFSNGAGFLQDPEGTYGVTQWAYYIAAPPSDLPNIEKAFRSEKFQELRAAIKVDSSSYNIPLMKLFSKNFWTLFIDE
jgi:hypothetical protein